MAKCPNCREQLSDESLHNKRCGKCGVRLNEDAASDQTVDSGDSSDFDALAKEFEPQSSKGTVDSTSVPEGGSIPPEGDDGQGPDNDDSVLDFSVQDPGGTEEDANSQTIDSPHLPDDFAASETSDSGSADFVVDEDALREDESYSETVYSSSVSDEHSELEDDAANDSKTTDEPDPPTDGTGSKSESQLNDTLDSAFDQLPVDLGNQGHGGKRTVDSVDLPDESGVNGSGTIHELPIDQTVDSVDSVTAGDVPQSAVPKDGTVNDRNPPETHDSTSLPPDSQTDDGTVRSRQHQQTFDSSVVDSAEAERMNQMWGGAEIEKASPQMTVHGRKSKSEVPQSSLVIQQRAILEQDDPNARADYDILSKLGKGGMGVVYAARQASIDRTVAIKMLKPKGAADPNQRNKFLSEAVITGELEHPNIVPIYDLGHNDENALFYAMKRVQGTPWNDAIRHKSLAENLETFMKCCDAVAFGHSRGIIHRDLKPENVMLGDYGEVLVMDWGLALPFGEHANSRTVNIHASMGGTPAYMAPEMATGPFDKMGPASDVYLLGAILFEIVAGRPPHQGKDVMKCLFAVAKNQIVKTDVTGELVDIAYQAMATKIKDRYHTVQDLQDAIRQYQEHSESIAMATRASEELAVANESDDYEGFSRAVFGYHEAYTLWNGNEKAKRGISRAKLTYAGSAQRKGDLDLALSLVDPEDETHRELQEEILAAQREREAKTYRLRRAKQAVGGLIAIVFAVVLVGSGLVLNQYNEAVKARQIADKQRDRAKKQEGIANTERDNAKEQEQIAKEQEEIAASERDNAKEQERIAKEQEGIAATERDKAREQERIAKEQERIATEQRDKAAYEAYVALIGLAGAKIEENAFDYARELLDRCDKDLQNWEWGRLKHLCEQSTEDFDAAAQINAAAFSPDGKRFVTGSWDGFAHIWQSGRERPVASIKHDGLYVYAVAWSPTRNQIATGSNSSSGFLRISDATTGKMVRVFKGHKEPVLSVKFSPDGNYLLSTSLDNTARLWAVKTGKESRPPFVGHNWWVWDAAFSPDGQHIVTASHDGTAMMWPVNVSASTPNASAVSIDPASPPSESLAGRATFAGHTGPVYAVAYSPDGKYVVSGGYDKQVLLWQPGKVQPFDFQEMLEGQSVASNFRVLGTHAAAVRSVVFSHDGKMVVSAGHDNTIKLWHVESGQLLQAMRGHGSWVRACAISPNDKWVLSGGYDKRAKLWSIDGYEEVRVLRGRVLTGHSDAVMSAAFSESGDKIVTASRDRTARSYNTEDGHELAPFVEGHSFLASTAQFFAKGTRLMTAAVDNTVRVWDVATGVEELKFDGTGIAAAAAVSASGRWILSGSQGDQQAKLWDLDTGKLVATLDGHKAEVTAVTFSPHDRFLFTGDANGRGVLWDRASQKQLRRLNWHTSRITAAAFLPDGTRLLTASDDKTVCTWDVSRLSQEPSTVQPLEQLVLKHPDTVVSLDVSRDGRTALTSCEDGRMRLWDLAAATVLREVPFDSGGIGFARLAPDGRSAISVHPVARTVRQWNLPDGREIISPASNGVLGPLLDLNIEGGLVWTAEYTPDGNAVLTVGGNEARLWSLGNEENKQRERMSFSPHGAVAAASFSPDGSRVVTASWDMTARIWDAESGRDLLKLGGHKASVNSAVFSPDGRRVLTSSDDKTAIVWDAQTGQVQLTLSGHGDRVRQATFSADGTLIATACEDQIARIWSAQDGTLLQELRGHEYGIASVAFSRDKKYVITGSDDKAARIWEVDSGQMVQLMASHTAAVTSVAFSPDGLRALTASEDFTAKLWDTTTGREILNLKGHTQEVTSVSFSENGRYALTSSRDGTAIVWLTVDWKKAAQAE